MNLSPTPYPDVNEIVHNLSARINGILRDQLIGIYLHGSLANGGFDKQSDIDIIVATKDDITDETLSALSAMHKEAAKMDSPWTNQLEVSYIPQKALRRFDRSNSLHPLLERGEGQMLHRVPHESDWVLERHVLRDRGITVIGPDPKSLIDPVSPNDIRQAVLEGMPIWFPPVIADPLEMDSRGYQSFFVLSTCRMLYTLRHGAILSKTAAAEWGKENLDKKWTPLIERALAGRQDPDLKPDPLDVSETVELMKYALSQIKPSHIE